MLRFTVAAAALAVSTWFALGCVQARDTGRAGSLVAGSARLSAARAAEVRSLLDSAGTLNPDRQVDLVRAHLAFDEHDYGTAIAILESVTRSEPQNVFAWSQLGYTAGAGGRLSVARLAGRHVAQLVPKIR
jgi:Flp pilus assembly protein TadD